MIDNMKSRDQQYKEHMPRFVATQNKYERMKKRGEQAAKEAMEQKQRVALLESQLEECQKVL